MFKNYLRVAFRSLRRQKGYAVLNVSGLAVGLACCGLIGLYVQDERSYDRFHERADRIYRLVREIRTDGEDQAHAATSDPMAPALAAELPGVERAVRVVTAGGLLERGVGAARVRHQEAGVVYADDGLFDVFTLPLLAGNPQTALAAPNTVVLSETLARKYFGDANPVGQPLLLDGGTPLTVTGVMGDVPPNTHLPFDAAVSWTTWEAAQRAAGDDGLTEEWGANYLFTYLLLAENTPPARVETALPAFVERHLAETANHFEHYALGLQPLTAIHLGAPRVSDPTPTTDPTRLYVFGVIGAFILLIACVNFVNLATARAAQRAKEVGLRKSLGAWRSQLVGQFLSESMLVSGAALVLAFLLSVLLLPGFNALAGKEISSLWAGGGRYALGLSALALIVGLGAGSYPAFVLSGFRPAAVLRGSFSRSRQGVRLRQGLVVLQFAVTIALLVGTGVVANQLRFVRSQDLGFDREQLLVVEFEGDAAVQEQAETVRQVLVGRPGVLGATVSSSTPGLPHSQLSVAYAGADGAPRESVMSEYAMDGHFLTTYDIPLVAGRGLIPGDTSRVFVLNEAAVARMGWASPEDALGQTFGLAGSRPGEIVGVVRDFHYHGLREAVEPLFMRARTASYDSFTLRLAPSDVQATVAAVERVWAELIPQRPFTYTFLDESFDQQYRADVQFGQVFGVFAGLAIVVACLGVFGLAAFTAQQRRKEIGVRKVLGASAASIVALLSRDVLRLVGVAFLVATPASYLAMGRWLEGFAYRVSLGPGVFLVAGALALVLAVLTVSGQALRAATADPITSLRSE